MDVDKLANQYCSPEFDKSPISPTANLKNIKAELSVKVNRISFNKTDDEIIYVYKLKNVGMLAIWSNITIINSNFPKHFIERIYIISGAHFNFTQRYQIKTSDLDKDYIVNSCIAYIEVCKDRYITTNQVDTCVSNGLNI